jgi:hypothetical protein
MKSILATHFKYTYTFKIHLLKKGVAKIDTNTPLKYKYTFKKGVAKINTNTHLKYKYTFKKGVAKIDTFS